MAADIGEGHHPAGGAAGHQDRHAGHVLAEIVAGLGQPGGEAHEDRLVAEQPIALQGRALTARIGRHAIAEHVAGQIRRAAVDMPEQPPPDGQFFLSFHGRILALRWGRATPLGVFSCSSGPRAPVLSEAEGSRSLMIMSKPEAPAGLEDHAAADALLPYPRAGAARSLMSSFCANGAQKLYICLNLLK
jgi:hypothetical protein